MRQIICIYLPSLPIDLACRKDPPLLHKPLALIHSSGGREVVLHASSSSQAIGIHSGMTLAAARSRCSELVVQPFDPQQSQRAYEVLARWTTRYTPVVAIEPPAIIAELGGSERAIGSVQLMFEQIARRLAKAGINALIAVAPTVGAAWALASTGRHEITTDFRSLASLPVDALRIDESAAIRLHQVGIDTIEQLTRLQRSELHARFGNEVLHRLDQAFGVIPEPIVCAADEEPILATVESEEPVTSIEAIWQSLRDLTAQVVVALSGRNQGARVLQLSLRPAYSPPIEKLITLSRPSRDVKNIYRLICLALENLEAREGFLSLQIEVKAAQKIRLYQREWVGDAKVDQRSELEDLADALQARLGHDRVLCPQLIESYIPERTCAWLPWPGEKSTASALATPRPLQIEHPVEIGVIVSPSEDREGNPVAFKYRGESHRLRVCVGPERIGGQWWDGHDKTRDYFDVEDELGQRFWIFRVLETFKWYLHGTF